MMPTETQGGSVSFEKISTEESWKVFDEAAQRFFDMSGDLLVKRWDAGEFKDATSVDLMRVLMLRPGGR
jgi:hypothetical protein